MQIGTMSNMSPCDTGDGDKIVSDPVASHIALISPLATVQPLVQKGQTRDFPCYKLGNENTSRPLLGIRYFYYRHLFAIFGLIRD